MNPKRTRYIPEWILGLALFAMASLVTGQTTSDVPDYWGTDWKSATEKAKAEDKPILAMFSAEWCPPCKMMKKDVLPTDVVKNALEPYVLVYIDGEEQPDLATRYQVENWPTFVLMDPQAQMFDSFAGGVGDPEQFVMIVSEMHENWQALQAIEAQLEKDPDNPMLLKKKGSVLADMGRIKEAMEIYQKARENDPENKSGVAADILYLEALTAAQKDLAKSDQMLTKLIEEHPQHSRAADAQFIRVMIAAEQGNYQESLEKARKFVADHPDHVRAEYTKRVIERLEEFTAGPGS